MPTTQTLWQSEAFVATPGNIPTTVVPPWIERVFVQVASGLSGPGAPLTLEKLTELQSRFDVQAWAWCVGPTQPQGGEPEEEAEWHAACARSIGATTFVANMESFYDAGGNQGDERFFYPRRYLAALDWDGPLGLTTTPAFGSDMTDWVLAGAIFMPQAFPGENHYDIDAVVQHAMDWGWPIEQIRPLVQCYKVHGERPDPYALRAQADEYGVGVVPYVIEQACDAEGQSWLEAMKAQIIRPTEGKEIDPMTVIGTQDGIKAACDRLRFLDPKGTAVGQTDGKWNDISTLGPDLNTWKAWDKLQRTLQILKDDHDAEAK